MSERGPAEPSPSSERVSGEQATVAATPSPTQPATPVPRAHNVPQDWAGRTVADRYVVLERLGEGGMGVVYVAEHLHLKKKVAFKVIHPELAAHEDLLLRFKREALATGQLDHSHIAAAIDFGELEDGGAFMVMPWVRGHSLQVELEKSGRMAYRRAALLCAQIADALSAAHAMGIVHRDLKPDNVLLETRTDGSEAAKVLDFGVASLAGRSEGLSVGARPLTQAGTILGTPGYMSPEQASAGEIDHRTDLYALGVILWELCRGERLFEGDDITAIFAKQFNSVPPPLELGSSLAARELSELVTKLLSWDKNQRPSSAIEVRDALRRIAELPDVSAWGPSLAGAQGLSRYVPYIVGGVALLAAILIVSFDDDDPQAISDENAVAAQASPSKAKAKDDSATKKPAKAAAPRVAVGAPEPTGSLREDQETVLTSRSREARRAAAKRLSKEADAVPRYVQLVAELELANRCNDKKGTVEAMRELSDPRVLPALERLADQPRHGCGLIRLNDCLGCLRRELDQTIGVLEHIGR